MDKYYIKSTTFTLKSKKLIRLIDKINDSNFFGVKFEYFPIKAISKFKKTIMKCDERGIEVLIDVSDVFLSKVQYSIEDIWEYASAYIRFVGVIYRFDNVIFALPHLPPNITLFKEVSELKLTLGLELECYDKYQDPSKFMLVLPCKSMIDFEKLLWYLGNYGVLTERVGIKPPIKSRWLICKTVGILRKWKVASWIHVFNLPQRLLQRLFYLINSSDGTLEGIIVSNLLSQEVMLKYL